MEIKTTMTTCINGHHYDAARHSSCPYCGSSARAVDSSSGAFPPTETPSGAFPPTEAPGSSGMFSPTESPTGAPAGYNPGFTPTTRPDVAPRGDNESGINPFSVETVIGGDAAPSGQLEPVVGWLVCIDGPVRGRDFRIHEGYNYIGREAGDIHLTGDPQVSRQNHAMVAFDSSELSYFVGPAAGRNLIKVNGKTVLNAVELNSYDIISIGTTKLIFIALCCEKFRWDGAEAANG